MKLDDVQVDNALKIVRERDDLRTRVRELEQHLREERAQVEARVRAECAEMLRDHASTMFGKYSYAAAEVASNEFHAFADRLAAASPVDQPREGEGE